MRSVTQRQPPRGWGDLPLCKANILRLQPDDDGDADILPEKGEPPVVPTKGRSALLSRDDAPALQPPGATSILAAAPASAPGAGAPTPRAAKLSGFKHTKRRDYAMVDQ